MFKSVCAGRNRKERDRLEANRLIHLRREEAEKESLQHTSSMLNSYIEKAKVRENEHLQERSQMVQNI